MNRGAWSVSADRLPLSTADGTPRPPGGAVVDDDDDDDDGATGVEVVNLWSAFDPRIAGRFFLTTAALVFFFFFTNCFFFAN